MRVAAATLAVAGGAALRVAHGAIPGELPAIALLPLTLGVAVLFGWLPGAALAAAALLAWRADPMALLGFGVAAAAQLALVAVLRSALRGSEADRAALRRQLDGDRALLREMQHRIANALQFLASLLSLQASRVTDADSAGEALADAAARLGTVARIHRRLHDPRLTGAALGELFQDVATQMLAARGLGPSADGAVRVRVHVDEGAGRLDPTQATALAMIVAEAATNAAKHAFDTTGRGALTIVLEERADAFVLAVTDDGPGPPDAAPTQDSLGLSVMAAMARRLDGQFRFGPGAAGGAAVEVVFRATPADAAA
ncbi:hypothetical protein ROS9278_03394 [Roseomonas sp. CECT 9278]|nr:hypothetical protein ROS9278_03394 [Roseomonas sp. CECT 9278]